MAWTRVGSGAGEQRRGAGARVQLPLDVSHSLLQSERPKNARKIPEKTQFLPFHGTPLIIPYQVLE